MAKILIIDDERAIRRALREILEFENFEVDEAENGKEGLEKAKAELYDIIFCDIKMPLMDGMEVLEAFREEKIDSPVIMISGHGNIDTAVQAIKMGAFDFIEKPFESKKLIHIIEKNLLELKQRITINNYRSQISFHSKVNLIGLPMFVDPIEKKLEKITFGFKKINFSPIRFSKK